MTGGYCAKHDNWHAECRRCLEEQSYQAGEKSGYAHIADWLRHSLKAHEILRGSIGSEAAILLAEAIELNRHLEAEEVPVIEPAKLYKGDFVRQPSTGRRGTVTRIRGGPNGQILIVDTCGSGSWTPPDQWTLVYPVPIRTKKAK